ncbi:MAG: hypothetical protein F9K43_25435, partial [Bauldia sp.]
MVATVGVVGAGTMGAGIAQLACLGGRRTLLHDHDPEALAAGVARVAGAVERGAEKGRWSAEESVAALGRLVAASELKELADCDLVIEAAPEELGLKQGLFAALEDACRAGAVLATNTSSLSVTAIAESAGQGISPGSSACWIVATGRKRCLRASSRETNPYF